MKLISFYVSLLFAPIAVSAESAEDTTSLLPQQRSLLRSKRSPVFTNISVDGFTVTVGTVASADDTCEELPSMTGDTCSPRNQQCLYPVLSAFGANVVENTYWSCACVRGSNDKKKKDKSSGKDGIFQCGVRCFGSEKCIQTLEPTPAPVPDGIVTKPPNFSWCSEERVVEQSDCEFASVVCSYLASPTGPVLDCKCKLRQAPPGSAVSFTKKWECEERDSETN
eukprot:CAMPEP_0172370074 /NCGR_PEP_ID=MMETSP1060-20121228/36107_1 /TAXON_ID=37318 /ORGANISM="Pseudo-nitzschia pungens, Strain cf. cingulata" /LENGTH=223 /DNA_ID=CAMNT_0013095231 /DNA_START=37 /DNA_END=708 /DNA_ORIENTATION=+